MKGKQIRKLGSLLLAFALALTTLAVSVTPAAAATGETEKYSSKDWEDAVADQEVRKPFSLDNNEGIRFTLAVASPVDVQVCLYNSAGVALSGYKDNPMTVSASEYETVTIKGSTAYAFGYTWKSMAAGDYYYGITFAENTSYGLFITQIDAATAKISQTSATITTGFTKTLSVSNGTVKKWSSGNSKIAKVSAKGKVTGVKKGKTTITATLKDGTKLKCKVTVKANKYSATKLTTSDVPSGKWYYQSYSAAYDSKGNLVVKVCVVNNTEKKISELGNIAVTVKNADGKKIGAYSQKTKSVSIESGASKEFTFTIKKSALKIKKTQDLRNAGITVTMDGYYYTYS